jgi:L-fucose isomerase-like protein
MRNSRLIGGKPKIGIRPIIDGRRGGIRESLEDMTMAIKWPSFILLSYVIVTALP